MSLYYHKNTYELKHLSDDLVSSWQYFDNPKKNEWILAPNKPTETCMWDNGSWIEPDPIGPQTVSARQIRLWLIRNNIQLNQIDSAIENIQDPLIKQTVKIEWEYAPYIERNHPWLVPLAQSLGLNEEQIDQAFREASLL